MIKTIKNKNGMTLVELLIGIIIFTLVTTAVLTILVPMIRAYAKANELAEYNSLLDNVAEHIISDLLDATIAVAPDELDDNRLWITVNNLHDIKYSVDSDDNILLRNDVPVLPRRYYKNKGVSFACEDTSDGSDTKYLLTVSLTEGDGNEAIVSRDYAIRPLVLNQFDD